MKAGRCVMILGFAMAACVPFAGFVHDETLAGPYRLVAVDADEQMMICRSIPASGDCVGDGLPGPTIFAAGANARYLVAARHPFDEPAESRERTEYYYVERLAGTTAADVAWDRTVGPLSGPAFLAARRRLGLPPFTRLFDALR